MKLSIKPIPATNLPEQDPDELKFLNLLAQAKKEAFRALTAIKLLNQSDPPAEEAFRFILLRAVLTHTATCSRILFPSNKDVERGERSASIANKICKVFGIEENSVLKSRDVRDASEHIDARIESWASSASLGQPFHENINGKLDYSLITKEVLMYYEIGKKILHRNRGGNVVAFELKPIIAELEKIK